MTEENLQRAVARYLDHHPATKGHWFHTPNGGQRSKATGGKLKAQGVKKGVPDVMIVKPYLFRAELAIMTTGSVTLEELISGRQTVTRNIKTYGLAIELKVGKNKTTPEQDAWFEVLRSCGWRCEVCRSLDEVMEVVKECYG